MLSAEVCIDTIELYQTESVVVDPYPASHKKKTMSGLVWFVLFLVNLHASNSFSGLFILGGTSPFTTHFYQNHQSSVIEQQAGLFFLAEKETEHLAVFDLHTHMLGEMLIAVMNLIWALLQCGRYKSKSTTCDGPQLLSTMLKHIVPPHPHPPPEASVLGFVLSIKEHSGEKSSTWDPGPLLPHPPPGWPGWDAWLNLKSHGSGL